MKRIIACILTLCMLFSIQGTVFAATSNQPTVTASAVTAQAGESVQVPIKLSDNTGICGATISVAYDDNLVLTSASAGDALSSLTFISSGDLTANPVNLVWDGAEADSSNGTIAVLTFTAPSEAGTYPISISYSDGSIIDEDLNPVNVKTINGSITVGSAATDSVEIVSVYSTVQNSAKVTWKAVDGAAGYQIYRATAPDGTFTCIKTITDGKTVKYTNGGLTVGQTYYYKVRAYTLDSSGNRVYSDFSEVRYMPATVVFTNVYSNLTTRIRLNWNAVSGAEGYQLWRADTANGTYKIVKTITSGSTTAYSNTGLEAGKVYYYKMRAYTTVNGSKVFGTYSDVFAVAALPKTPNLTVTSTTAGKAKLTWDTISGAAGYQIWRKDGNTGTYTLIKSITDGSTVSYTNSGLASGTTYSYRVRAYTEVNGKKTFGAYSTIVTVTAK